MANRELKFICPPWADRVVLSGLSHRCVADRDYSNNIVQSIYFDTSLWDFAAEKAASDFLKTKVRIRWYSPVDADRSGVKTAFLEIKRKTGSTRQKSRIALDIDVSAFERAPDDRATLDLLRRNIVNLAPDLGTTDLLPRIKVKYQRRRFVDPLTGSRIAFDSQICGYAVDNAPVTRHFTGLDYSVLEIKGKGEEKPTNLRFLDGGLLRKAAFSKYYECYCGLTGYTQ